MRCLFWSNSIRGCRTPARPPMDTGSTAQRALDQGIPPAESAQIVADQLNWVCHVITLQVLSSSEATVVASMRKGKR